MSSNARNTATLTRSSASEEVADLWSVLHSRPAMTIMSHLWAGEGDAAVSARDELHTEEAAMAFHQLCAQVGTARASLALQAREICDSDEADQMDEEQAGALISLCTNLVSSLASDIAAAECRSRHRGSVPMMEPSDLTPMTPSWRATGVQGLDLAASVCSAVLAAASVLTGRSSSTSGPAANFPRDLRAGAAALPSPAPHIHPGALLSDIDVGGFGVTTPAGTGHAAVGLGTSDSQALSPSHALIASSDDALDASDVIAARSHSGTAPSGTTSAPAECPHQLQIPVHDDAAAVTLTPIAVHARFSITTLPPVSVAPSKDAATRHLHPQLIAHTPTNSTSGLCLGPGGALDSSMERPSVRCRSGVTSSPSAVPVNTICTSTPKTCPDRADTSNQGRLGMNEAVTASSDDEWCPGAASARQRQPHQLTQSSFTSRSPRRRWAANSRSSNGLPAGATIVKRRALPVFARKFLISWLLQNFEDPYPTDAQRQALAAEVGCTDERVQTFFTNARARVWRPFVLGKKGWSIAADTAGKMKAVRDGTAE